ncbi:MAG: TRAP transporter substrate-binding protein DctP [Gordonia sp. (in: high G+C Gram-positive bacteria)]|uniref:TRAP transporter substrate-binding protein n=1 Tax=Gordonia sp. (in: high G+C Gram-positive bacteria) TaxID=84139 RepID=UPI0039E66FBC
MRGTRRRAGRIRAWAALCALALLAVTGCAVGEDRGVTTLVFADNFSPTHPIGAGGVQPFIEHLREHGPAVGLDVDYFGAGQLGKQKDVLTLLDTGAIDMGLVIPAYLADALPLTGVGELPGLVTDSCAAGAAMMPMVSPGGLLYETELANYGVLPLWPISIPGYEIFTATEKVSVPADVKGLMIRTPGGIGDRIVRGLGAAPVSIPGPDLYEAIARATVSGAMLTRISVKSYSLEEIIGYSTLGANLSATSIYVSIDHEKWKTLTAAQQKVIRDASAMAQGSVCKALTAASDKAVEFMRSAGMHLHEITEAERPAWDAALTPIRADWVRDLESAGLPAAAALDEFEKRIGGASDE